MGSVRGRGVQVARVGESVTFSGAAPCGRRSCPVCGQQLALDRRAELEQLIAGAKSLGYVVRFGTFTLRHSRRHELGALLDAVLACWRGLTSSGAWSRAARAAGLVGFVRVVETKYGVANGWHPHVHALLFFRPGPALASRLDAFGTSITDRWAALTDAAGFSATTQRGVTLTAPTGDHLDGMAGYVTKGWGLAAEMTAGAFKSSREHWTPQDLLAMGAGGNWVAADLFREYEGATQGRRLYAPLSAAVRTVLQNAPVPMEDRPAPDPRPVRTPLADVPSASWGLVARGGLRPPLVDVALDAADGWDVVWWLDAQGIRSAPASTADAAGTPLPASAYGASTPPDGSPPWLALP